MRDSPVGGDVRSAPYLSVIQSLWDEFPQSFFFFSLTFLLPTCLWVFLPFFPPSSPASFFLSFRYSFPRFFPFPFLLPNCFLFYLILYLAFVLPSRPTFPHTSALPFSCSQTDQTSFIRTPESDSKTKNYHALRQSARQSNRKLA